MVSLKIECITFQNYLKQVLVSVKWTKSKHKFTNFRFIQNIMAIGGGGKQLFWQVDLIL